MHCFISEFNTESTFISLNENELKHYKVLRIRDNERILICNGNGVTAICDGNSKNHFLPIEFYNNHNELENEIIIGISLTQDKSRIEFAIEKLVEIGVCKIYLIESRFTQKVKINIERLNKKAISAVKQSNRSIIPKIIGPIRLKDIPVDDDLAYFIASKNGSTKIGNQVKSFAFIGPEAGFDKDEIDYIRNHFKAKELKLSNSILRTETAAILCAGKLIGK